MIGGTVFLGRHVVDSLLARGHEVTLFNRGESGPDLYPDLERVLGDRDGDIERLGDRRFDAVIDTCGYAPRIVGASARYLADRADHYTFVSSVSVYDLKGRSQPVAEDAPVRVMDDPAREDITGDTYGALKALCEAAAEAAMPGRVFNVRPGLIAGPYDPTDRYTWWPHRLRRGGRVLAPLGPSTPTQYIDARDLADWIVRAAESRLAGAFHATGPAAPTTLGAFLPACAAAVGGEVELIWWDEAALEEAEFALWKDLPMAVPAEVEAMQRCDISAALAAGLTHRPMAETARDTLAWADTRGADHEWKAGLDPAREAAALGD